MYCYNCGKYNQENDIFCFNCGVRLSHPALAVPIVQKTELTEESKEKVRLTLKKYLRSPMLLIALILMTVSVVLGYFVPSTVYYEDIPEYEDFGDGFVSPLSANSVSDTQSESSIYENVILSVLGIESLNLAWIISGWFVYIFALTKKSRMKLGGLGMASIVAFINRIRCYVISALVVLLVVLMCVSFAMMGVALVLVAFVLLLPLVGGIVFLCIIWAHKLHKTVRSIKIIYETGNADQTISLFVAIVCFVTGATLLSVIGYDYLTLSTTALYVASNILLGIQLLRLRGAMKELAKEQENEKIPVHAGQVINNNVMI